MYYATFLSYYPNKHLLQLYEIQCELNKLVLLQIILDYDYIFIKQNPYRTHIFYTDLLILHIAFNYYYNNLFILEIARSIPAIHFTMPSPTVERFSNI